MDLERDGRVNLHRSDIFVARLGPRIRPKADIRLDGPGLNDA